MIDRLTTMLSHTTQFHHNDTSFTQIIQIFPRVAVHTRKLTLNGTFTFHILLHGKEEASTSIPEKESMRKKDLT
jgi:hypothetical protein